MFNRLKGTGDDDFAVRLESHGTDIVGRGQFGIETLVHMPGQVQTEQIGPRPCRLVDEGPRHQQTTVRLGEYGRNCGRNPLQPGIMPRP